MVDSIHVARWLSQFDPTEVKFILFPSGPNRRIHPKIAEMIQRGKDFDNQMSLVPLGGKLSLPLWALDRLFSDRIRGLLLRRILKRFNPDFVHALEFQHAGYVTIRALEDKRIRTPFIATNYGSDIYWFKRFKFHLRRIIYILRRADYYSCECIRDYYLARNLGFEGTVLPIWPNSGIPAPADEESLVPVSRRNTIVAKGYDGWAGKANNFLKSVPLLGSAFQNISIVLLSCNLKVKIFARIISWITGITIFAYSKNALREEEVQSIFRRSRVYVGLSKTDGVSTSCLEAMSQGVFPIQSSTSCAGDWFDSGVSGFSVEGFDPHEIAQLVTKYFWDIPLLEKAAKVNAWVIRQRQSELIASGWPRVVYQLEG